MLAHLLWFSAGILLMTALTTGLCRWAGVDLRWSFLVAIVRAAVQLTVVALLLRGILGAPATIAAFVALMLTTASWTARSRLRDLWHGPTAAVAGVCAGALTSLGVVFGLHLVAFEARNVAALGGIIVGGAMTASSLSGRNFRRTAATRSAEVEAWFSLGATPSQAHLTIGQESVKESLIPTIDQARSTGLVTLPGAFVGALFGGASPQQAAEFQLVVLAGIALAMTVTGVVVTRLVGRSPFVTVDA